MDIPSLFMIPSAVSSGKVHSVFPNSTDADFDFNRDSDATRVNSEGLIERVGYYGSELVTNGDFSIDAHWTQGSNISISNGKLVFDNANRNTDFAQQSITAPTGVTYKITFTVSDLKSGDSIKVRYPFQDTTVDTNGTHTLFGVGTTANFIRFTPNSLTGTFKLDNVSVKQVTGDRARLNYEIEGGLVNTKPSLLLEPQSTNLNTHTNLGDSSWLTSGTNKVSNNAISPDGTNTATKVTLTTSTANHYIYKNVTAVASNTYTVSCFIKRGTGNFAAVGINQRDSSNLFVGAVDFVYDFDNNTIGSAITGGTAPTNASANVEEYNNGWYRLSVTATLASNAPTLRAVISVAASTSSIYHAGNGRDNIYVFGCQIEQQSYPTSLIPTNGSTQTRAAETCIGAGTSSILPSEEGILYAEIAALSDSITTSVFSISNGSSANTLYMGFPNTTNVIQAQLVVGGVAQTNMNHTVSDRTSFNKVAVLFRNNNHKMFIGGVEVETDTSGSTPSAGTFDRINFDLGQGSFDFYGKIRDIRVYNTKEMTDSEVDILLTKITS